MIAIDLFRGLCLQAVIVSHLIGYSCTENIASTRMSMVSDDNDNFRTRVFRTGLSCQPELNVVNAHIHTFNELVCGSKSFVDTSLLIRFLADNKRVLVALPRAFGKSINLMMIYTFYQMEIRNGTLIPVPRNETKAFQMFELGRAFCNGKFEPLQDKFLVTNYKGEDFYEEMGSTPVVYINFGNPPYLDDFEGVCRFVKGVLERSLSRHDYILHATASSPGVQYFQASFKGIIDQLNSESADDITMVQITPQLIDLLYEIFDKNVLVLVDKYDSIMNHIHFTSANISELDKQRTMMFLASFFGHFTKHNEYVSNVFMTGIMNWMGVHFFTDIARLSIHSIRGGEATQFYGMEEDIVRELLNDSGLLHTMDKVRLFYDGYNFGDSSGQKLIKKYNPCAIACFIETKGISRDMNEWTKTTSKILKPLLRYKKFHEYFLALISYDEFAFKVNILRGATFNMPQMDMLTSALQQANVAPKSDWYALESPRGLVDVALYLFLATGYLTRSEQQTTSCSNNTDYFWSGCHCFPVKITNQEIRNALVSEYFMYVSETPNLPEQAKIIEWRTSLTKLAQKLSDVLQARQPDYEEFAKAFELMLGCYTNITYEMKSRKQKAYANEALYESLFTSVIHYNILKIGTKRHENQHRIDGFRPTVVCEAANGTLTIFEVKYLPGDCNMQDVMEMLDSGGRQTIEYAKWYLNGPGHDLYKLWHIKIVLLLVKESDHGVVLRTYTLKDNDISLWTWIPTTY